MDKYYVTKDRLEELTAELAHLKTDKRMEIAERLKTAKEYGDLTENSEYSEAREAQEYLEKRIYELEELMKKVVVIRKHEGADKVRVGSRVTVETGKKTFVYEIVGPQDTKPEEGKISNESPIGKALLNCKVGESVKVTTPRGEISYHILKVE